MEYATESGTVLFEPLWMTSENRLVPVKDMDDEHLLNTIDYLQRRGETRENGAVLPFLELPKYAHNIEVLKREILRRTPQGD